MGVYLLSTLTSDIGKVFFVLAGPPTVMGSVDCVIVCMAFLYSGDYVFVLTGE